MESDREPFAPHRGGRRGVGIAEGRRQRRSTARATTGTAPPTRAKRAPSVAVVVAIVAVAARGVPPRGAPLWCLIHVLVRFFASTCGSGAVPFAPRRAGCLVLARWFMWWGVVSLRHMGRARCLRQPPWNFHGGWRVPAVRLVGFVLFRFLAETRPGRRRFRVVRFGLVGALASGVVG